MTARKRLVVCLLMTLLLLLAVAVQSQPVRGTGKNSPRTTDKPHSELPLTEHTAADTSPTTTATTISTADTDIDNADPVDSFHFGAAPEPAPMGPVDKAPGVRPATADVGAAEPLAAQLGAKSSTQLDSDSDELKSKQAAKSTTTKPSTSTSTEQSEWDHGDNGDHAIDPAQKPQSQSLSRTQTSTDAGGEDPSIPAPAAMKSLEKSTAKSGTSTKSNNDANLSEIETESNPDSTASLSDRQEPEKPNSLADKSTKPMNEQAESDSDRAIQYTPTTDVKLVAGAVNSNPPVNKLNDGDNGVLPSESLSAKKTQPSTKPIPESQNKFSNANDYDIDPAFGTETKAAADASHVKQGIKGGASSNKFKRGNTVDKPSAENPPPKTDPDATDGDGLGGENVTPADPSAIDPLTSANRKAGNADAKAAKNDKKSTRKESDGEGAGAGAGYQDDPMMDEVQSLAPTPTQTKTKPTTDVASTDAKNNAGSGKKADRHGEADNSPLDEEDGDLDADTTDMGAGGRGEGAASAKPMPKPKAGNSDLDLGSDSENDSDDSKTKNTENGKSSSEHRTKQSIADSKDTGAAAKVSDAQGGDSKTNMDLDTSPAGNEDEGEGSDVNVNKDEGKDTDNDGDIKAKADRAIPPTQPLSPDPNQPVGGKLTQDDGANGAVTTAELDGEDEDEDGLAPMQPKDAGQFERTESNDKAPTPAASDSPSDHPHDISNSSKDPNNEGSEDNRHPPFPTTDNDNDNDNLLPAQLPDTQGESTDTEAMPTTTPTGPPRSEEFSLMRWFFHHPLAFALLLAACMASIVYYVFVRAASGRSSGFLPVNGSEEEAMERGNSGEGDTGAKSTLPSFSALAGSGSHSGYGEIEDGADGSGATDSGASEEAYQLALLKHSDTSSHGAVALVETVLTKIGIPSYGQATFIQKLKDSYLTQIAQLHSLDQGDWRRLALPLVIEEAIRAALDQRRHLMEQPESEAVIAPTKRSGQSKAGLTLKKDSKPNSSKTKVKAEDSVSSNSGPSSSNYSKKTRPPVMSLDEGSGGTDGRSGGEEEEGWMDMEDF